MKLYTKIRFLPSKFPLPSSPSTSALLHYQVQVCCHPQQTWNRNSNSNYQAYHTSLHDFINMILLNIMVTDPLSGTSSPVNHVDSIDQHPNHRRHSQGMTSHSSISALWNDQQLSSLLYRFPLLLCWTFLDRSRKSYVHLSSIIYHYAQTDFRIQLQLSSLLYFRYEFKSCSTLVLDLVQIGPSTRVECSSQGASPSQRPHAEGTASGRNQVHTLGTLCLMASKIGMLSKRWCGGTRCFGMDFFSATVILYGFNN